MKRTGAEATLILGLIWIVYILDTIYMNTARSACLFELVDLRVLFKPETLNVLLIFPKSFAVPVLFKFILLQISKLL